MVSLDVESGETQLMMSDNGSIISGSTAAATDVKTKKMLIAGVIDTRGFLVCERSKKFSVKES